MISAGFVSSRRGAGLAEHRGPAPGLPAAFASVERLDARLAELARGAGRARLVIGELLEALAKQGGHHDLGVSSLEAYARERAGRSGRWAERSERAKRVGGGGGTEPPVVMSLASSMN